MAQSTIAMIIISLAVVCFVTRIIPVPVAAISASLAMGIFGVIPFSTAFSGFSSDVMMMVLGSEIVGEAIFQSGTAHRIGKKILEITGQSEKMFMLLCAVVAAIGAAFASNLATVVIMMPMIAASAAVSKGLIKKKNIFMCIGYASMIGGGMTLIGSFPNLIGQAFLNDFGMEPMSFWSLTWISMPRFIVFLLFYATIGYSLQKKVFDFPEEVPPSPESDKGTESENSFRLWIPVILMIGMTIGLTVDIWTPGAVAMTAAMLCIITRCISLKTVYKQMDWNTLWILAGGLGFAYGLSGSGAGEIIANTIIGWFGNQISFFALICIFSLLGVLLVNLVTASTAMTMLAPIALFICQQMGYDGRAMVMALVMILNLTFISPYATAPVTVTLAGGYRFSDYVKVGGVLTFVMVVITLITFAFYI